MDAILNEEAFLYQLLFGKATPEVPSSLGEPDWQEVRKTRSRIERDLEFGVGVGRGLTEIFPLSLGRFRANLPGQNPIRLFLESPFFAAYREVPFAGLGLSLDEAFFQFLRQCLPECERLFREEFYPAIFKQLTLQRTPAFRLDCPEILRVPRGWCALLDTAHGVMLYAALEQGFVHGPVTPLIAEMIQNPTAPADDPERQLIRSRLAAMGLM